MNINNIILGTLGAVVVMFGLGVLWHLSLFPDWYKTIQYASRPEILVPFMFLGELLRAFFMVIIYPYGYKGGSAVKEGLRFGVLMSLFLAGVIVPWFYGLHVITSFWCLALLEGLFLLVSGALAGIVIALVYEKSKG